MSVTVGFAFVLINVLIMTGWIGVTCWDLEEARQQIWALSFTCSVLLEVAVFDVVKEFIVQMIHQVKARKVKNYAPVK
jgi:hypothetical protein